MVPRVIDNRWVEPAKLPTIRPVARVFMSLLNLISTTTGRAVSIREAFISSCDDMRGSGRYKHLLPHICQEDRWETFASSVSVFCLMHHHDIPGAGRASFGDQASFKTQLAVSNLRQLSYQNAIIRYPGLASSVKSFTWIEIKDDAELQRVPSIIHHIVDTEAPTDLAFKAILRKQPAYLQVRYAIRRRMNALEAMQDSSTYSHKIRALYQTFARYVTCADVSSVPSVDVHPAVDTERLLQLVRRYRVATLDDVKLGDTYLIMMLRSSSGLPSFSLCIVDRCLDHIDTGSDTDKMYAVKLITWDGSGDLCDSTLCFSVKKPSPDQSHLLCVAFRDNKSLRTLLLQYACENEASDIGALMMKAVES